MVVFRYIEGLYIPQLISLLVVSFYNLKLMQQKKENSPLNQAGFLYPLLYSIIILAKIFVAMYGLELSSDGYQTRSLTVTVLLVVLEDVATIVTIFHLGRFCYSVVTAFLVSNYPTFIQMADSVYLCSNGILLIVCLISNVVQPCMNRQFYYVIFLIPMQIWTFILVSSISVASYFIFPMLASTNQVKQEFMRDSASFHSRTRTPINNEDLPFDSVVNRAGPSSSVDRIGVAAPSWANYSEPERSIEILPEQRIEEHSELNEDSSLTEYLKKSELFFVIVLGVVIGLGSIGYLVVIDIRYLENLEVQYFPRSHNIYIIQYFTWFGVLILALLGIHFRKV